MKTLALLSNFKLVWIGLPAKNDLAYLVVSDKEKRFYNIDSGATTLSTMTLCISICDIQHI
jgi:hypothetical protein